MPKKKGKKKKQPAFYTSAEHLHSFGLSVNEIIKTPLGLHGTVIGIKYPGIEQAESFLGGKVWIKYDNGLEAPIEYDSAHGFSKGSVAEHIYRDVEAYNKELERIARERRAQEEVLRLRALGIELPSKSKEKKGKSSKKKKK